MRLNHTIFAREERLTIAWRLRSAMMLSEEGDDRRCIMALTMQQIQPVAHRYTARGAVALEWLAEDANGDRMYSFHRPWSDGTTGIKLSPLELLEKLSAFVPLPRVHLVRYAGCLAPHSTLRDAIIPTPCQQGVDGEETKTGTPL